MADECHYHLPSNALDEKENVDPDIIEFLANLKYQAHENLKPPQPEPYDFDLPRRTPRVTSRVDYTEDEDLKMLAHVASHRRRLHEKPVTCDVCGKTVQSRHLRLHAKSKRHRRALAKLTQS